MILSIRYITFIIILILGKSLLAADFEGKISMVQETCFDTTFYNYYVSKSNIRIEELSSQKIVTGIYLINLEKEEVYFIHPSKEIYTKLKKSKTASEKSIHYEIRKTENSKIINGTQCYQWRVRNKMKNTEFAYWVTQNNFDFFVKMTKVLNQYDMNWDFFNKIPGNEGFFPMMSEERNLVRDKKMTTEVLQIKRKSLDDSMFLVPRAYRLMTM